MFGLFAPVTLTTHGSSTSLPELDQAAALKEAMAGLDALLNDDLNGNALLCRSYYFRSRKDSR